MDNGTAPDRDGTRYVVGTRQEVRPGAVKTAFLGARRVAVLCTDEGRYHALADSCPHQGAPLSSGKVERCWIGADVGEYRRGRNVHVVCPWHNFEFDVATGRTPYEDDKLRVRSYDVVVEGEELVIYAA